MSKDVVFNETTVVTNVSTMSSPIQVESSSSVTSQSESAPTPSSSSSRGRRSSPRLVKTVTFATPLETVISSSPAPGVAASPPPSTRHVPPSAYTESVPAGGKKRRGVRARGGVLTSNQRRSLRRRGLGRQPNSPHTRASLRNLSTAFAFLGTHSDPSSNPWGPTQARRLPDGESYQQAILGEMGSMTDHHVADLVDPPEGANAIGTR